MCCSFYVVRFCYHQSTIHFTARACSMERNICGRASEYDQQSFFRMNNSVIFVAKPLTHFLGWKCVFNSILLWPELPSKNKQWEMKNFRNHYSLNVLRICAKARGNSHFDETRAKIERTKLKGRKDKGPLKRSIVRNLLFFTKEFWELSYSKASVS
jgi:hypothetical protein